MTTRHSAYTLACIADCASPDAVDSPGARFLDSIQDAVNDAVSDGRADEDTAAEIADGAPDVYTHAMFGEFVDLCAYREDPSELGADGSDMEQAARVCLYMIAERLANALLAESADEDEDDEVTA